MSDKTLRVIAIALTSAATIASLFVGVAIALLNAEPSECNMVGACHDWEATG